MLEGKGGPAIAVNSPSRQPIHLGGDATLFRLTRSLQTRMAQIHASTLFAVILAIVAGLIFAWVFKMVFLSGKPKPVTAPPTRRLTVAATNLLDKMQIMPGQVKTITVSEDEYNTLVNDPKNRSRVMLTGNQPIARTTLKPVRAEEPIFEDQLEPLQYPEPVSARLRDGKRAVNIQVPADSAMIQVGDRVDVFCTLGNDTLGSSGNVTAALAKGLRVVARFGTTRTAAQPTSLTAPRTYTLEASPYRANLIGLAQSIGGTFSLLVSPRQAGDDGTITAAADSSLDDPQSDRVTTEDLARIFGIQPATPIPVWHVERYTGVSRSGQFAFPGYTNAGPERLEKPAEVAPAKSSGNGARPQAPNGNGRPKSPITPASTGSPTSSNFRVPAGRLSPTTATAMVGGESYGVHNNFGFRPAGKSKAGCKTCGH